MVRAVYNSRSNNWKTHEQCCLIVVFFNSIATECFFPSADVLISLSHRAADNRIHHHFGWHHLRFPSTGRESEPLQAERRQLRGRQNAMATASRDPPAAVSERFPLPQRSAQALFRRCHWSALTQRFYGLHQHPFQESHTHLNTKTVWRYDAH